MTELWRLDDGITKRNADALMIKWLKMLGPCDRLKEGAGETAYLR